MSRRTLQNRKRFVQATIKMMGEGLDRKKQEFRPKDEAIALLSPSAVVKGDGTAFRGGRHPDAAMHGTAGQVCTKPRLKKFSLVKGKGQGQ